MRLWPKRNVDCPKLAKYPACPQHPMHDVRQEILEKIHSRCRDTDPSGRRNPISGAANGNSPPCE